MKKNNQWISNMAIWLRKNFSKRIYRNLTMACSIIVVFSVTYALILPVISMDKETSLALPGIYLNGGTGSSEEQEVPETEGTEGRPETSVDGYPGMTKPDPDNHSKTDPDEQTEGYSNKEADNNTAENQSNDPDEDQDHDTEDTSADHSDHTDEDSNVRSGKDENLSKLVCRREDYTAVAVFDTETGLPKGTVLRVDELRRDDKDPTIVKKYHAVRDMTGDRFGKEYPDEKMSEFRLFEVHFLTEEGKELDHVRADIRITFKNGIILPEKGRAIGSSILMRGGVIKPQFVKYNKLSRITDQTPEVVAASEGKIGSLTLTEFQTGDKALERLAGLVISVPKKKEKTPEYNSGTLEKTGEDYAVSVEVTEKAKIPKGASLNVRPVRDTDHYMKLAKKELGTDEIVSARFFDIGFYMDGREIEPACPVDVTIKIAEKTDGKVVHFSDNGPEVLESETEIINKRDHDDYGTSVSFQTDGFSIYGIVETTLEKMVLSSDGHNYGITVTCGADAEVPEGAELEVSEIRQNEKDNDGTTEYDNYLEKTKEALGLESGEFEYARIFDIKIVDKKGKKVEIASPVDVKIELADKESGKEAKNNNTHVVHFADGSQKGDVLDEVAVEGEMVQFTADGFSAYAIVEGPKPASPPQDIQTVTTLDELTSNSTQAFYLSYGKTPYYFTNDLNSNKAFIETQDYDAASEWFLKPVENSTNQFYLCTMVNGTEQYVSNPSSNNAGLTTSMTNRAKFELSETDGGLFYFKLAGQNKWLQHSGSGSGIRFYTDNNNATNSRIRIAYASSFGYDSDPYDLDGKSRGLMFWDNSLYGKAMMASSENPNALDAKALMVLATSDGQKQLFVPNDSDISMWTFHWVKSDKYYLTATVEGSTKYLKINANGLSLADNESGASRVQVIPGTGAHAGEICLKSGGTTLTYSGTASSGFSTGGEVGTEWLNLVQLSELTSDYYKTYSARKVSVSDTSITTGSKVIVYTRAWNEETLKYEYYAIDHDGTLVRVYEDGDSIEWVGNIINTMLWEFTDYPDEEDPSTPSYYYELYNEYAQKYIAPQELPNGQSQIVADNPIGINMNGRRYGQYYSTILTWDEDDYTYAGLKVENGQIVACPKAEAMDFYFAVMEEIPVDDALTTVNTVDHTQYGITMKLVDFNGSVINGTGCTTTQEQHDVMGYSNWSQQTAYQQTNGLLSTKLGSNGYPTATRTNKSLAQLFATDDAKEVNHLFIQSTYNASGYYEFNSAQNFASLNGAAGGEYTNEFDGDFTVYKELGSYDRQNKDTLKHGQFLPFNNIQAGHFTTVNKQNLYTVTGDSLPDTDPRKYENLYLVNNPNTADLYFGVELEAGFTQTPNGLDDWGHDIIFEFTGDDDFWLYVDGELVIDLGGIHSALPGSVNFRTGHVNVNGTDTTLRTLFESNYRGRNPNATDAEVTAFLAKYFDEGSTIFRDYSTHTMKIFYMERGGGASNLHMRFNLASVKPGTVELSKKLAGVDESESTMAEFAYQIKYKKKNDESEYLLSNSGTGISDPEDYVFYKNTTNPVTFEPTKTIGGKEYNNVFILKPGETAVINFPTFGADNEKIESYSIVECGVNTEVYEKVTVNGDEINGEAVAGAANRMDYGLDYKSTDDRQRVNYVNEVNPDAKRTLTFKKVLYEADGTTLVTSDSTPFSFRLYFGTESDTELAGANMYTYHVKDKDGNYCYWDTGAQNFEKIGNGITEYSDLSDTQKVAASFSTSMNGAISKIPKDYTVEVRQILAGTQYQVRERPKDIPDGYSFQRYVYYEDVDNESPTETYTVAAAGAPDSHNNVITTGNDPHVDICNLKGWGLRVNKVWTDADYMTNRDDTFFAVYAHKQNGNEYGQGHGQWLLVDGSLRALPYGKTTLYWYWLRLPVNAPFDDYVIREVEIKNGVPVVDENGIVTNESALHFQEIREGETLTLNGIQKGETNPAEFTYTVHYDKGEISSESNVRVDTVTNDRPGIILKKQDWSGNPLPGATFTLESEGTQIGTFTSDSDGNITTAFLSKDKNYTLTETSAPQTYHGLEKPMTIQVTSDTGHGSNGSAVTVNGLDEEYYILTQAQGTNPATLIIKDRPFIFQAIKQDGDTNLKLQGVHFEVHKQVTVGGVTSFDDAVLAGYEDLVTDENGLIPRIDNTLPAGTYQLREKNPPNGYQTLPKNVEFTVSKTGAISLLPSMASADWISLTESQGEDDSLVYTMIIRNYIDASVTIKKVDDTGANLFGSKFRLCKYGTSWEAVSTYSEIDLTERNQITLLKLSVGRYRLEETQIPNGYVVLNKYIYFNIGQDGTVSLTDDTGTGDNSNENASISATGNIITVKNTPGAALPFSGGPGTTIFYIYGCLLIAFAGISLMMRRRKKF